MSAEGVGAAIDAHDRVHTLAFHARTQPHPKLVSELDAFVESLPVDEWPTFQGIGDAWHEIDAFMAGRIVRRILEFDLAYNRREIDEQNASKICVSFLELFSPDARFFTNGLFTDYGWSGWGSVANATFETGVIALDSRNIGILWCHDED